MKFAHAVVTQRGMRHGNPELYRAAVKSLQRSKRMRKLRNASKAA